MAGKLGYIGVNSISVEFDERDLGGVIMVEMGNWKWEVGSEL